jgi:hypothetical protein
MEKEQPQPRQPNLARADELAEFYSHLVKEQGTAADFNPVFNLSDAYRATRAREAKLEAALREIGRCRFTIHDGSTRCNAGRLKYTVFGRSPEDFDHECPNCKGTGLARETRDALAALEVKPCP